MITPCFDECGRKDLHWTQHLVTLSVSISTSVLVMRKHISQAHQSSMEGALVAKECLYLSKLNDAFLDY